MNLYNIGIKTLIIVIAVMMLLNNCSVLRPVESLERQQFCAEYNYLQPSRSDTKETAEAVDFNIRFVKEFCKNK